MKEQYVQVDPLQPTAEAVKLEQLLGAGTAGQAWTCTLFEKKYVVKFPAQTPVSRLPDGTCRIRLLPRPPKAEIDQNLESFNFEFNNFERMMEPDVYTRDFVNGEHWPSRLHTDTPEENRDRYVRYANAMRELRLLPGHAHMHQLLHIAYLDHNCLPLIFSTPCDGSLRGFTQSCEATGNPALQPTRGRPSKLWLSLASQLALAMKFMSSRGFVSVDIKLDNIFYKRAAGEEEQQMHFMIADYGLCTSADYKGITCTEETWVPRGPPALYPYHAYEPELRSDSMARHQIAIVLEMAVDRRAPLHFHFSLPPTLMSTAPYLQAIYDIRSAVNGRQIDRYYAGLVSLLRADGYPVD
jgi:serine/threonine protein kinase